MPLLDVFNEDAFSVVSLTASINKMPFQPQRIGAMGIFNFKPLTTLVAVVEEKQGKLGLIPAKARGTHDNAWSRANQVARSFVLPHLPLDGAVWAEDIQSVRAFGSENTVETIATAVNDELESLRASHETTHEYYRVKALQGLLVDADGTTELYNWFTEFGLTQDVVNYDMTSVDNGMGKDASVAVTRLIEDALGGSLYTSIHAFCGDQWFDAFTSHPGVERAWERWLDGEFLRTTQRGKSGVGGGFPFCGVFYENYRGAVGAVPFIPTDEAIAFPTGVNDLFIENFGPADFIETVNTRGQRVYAKQARMKFDKGIEIHSQSNPLMLPTRPQCLIQLTGTFV